MGENERERNNVWLPLECPLLEIWSATQGCALTGNQTSNPLVCSPAPNPLSHTSQGGKFKCTWHWRAQYNEAHTCTFSNYQLMATFASFLPPPTIQIIWKQISVTNSFHSCTQRNRFCITRMLVKWQILKIMIMHNVGIASDLDALLCRWWVCGLV